MQDPVIMRPSHKSHTFFKLLIETIGNNNISNSSKIFL